MRGDPPEDPTSSVGKQTSTPHARGSTVNASSDSTVSGVYPACAGIHPGKREIYIAQDCLPRMRGDPPHQVLQYHHIFWSTPHARGSTPPARALTFLPEVYPACAGIHRTKITQKACALRLPRMRGDPPDPKVGIAAISPSTPHARGSTSWSLTLSSAVDVYPACAGIHPQTITSSAPSARLPRMRGDPPQNLQRQTPPSESTPHARGSTL